MGIKDYLSAIFATILTGGLYPLSNLIYRKTKSVCKHSHTGSTQVEIYKKCLRDNAFDMNHYRLVILHLQMIIFKKIKFPSSDSLYIVPVLGKSWGVNTDKVHFTDFEYAIEMLTNYKTNLVEAEIFLDESIKSDFHQTRVTMESPERHNALKNCVVDMLLSDVPAWYITPSREDGKKVWNFSFDDAQKDITFGWVSYDTREVKLIQKDIVNNNYTDPENWYVKVVCTGGDYDERTDVFDEMAVYCLENVVTLICQKNPSAFHSWVHFPYSDLASVWIAQKQDESENFTKIDNPFYKMLRFHTLATKWNCINVKSRGVATHNEFDAFDSEAPATPFTMNSSTLLSLAYESTAQNQFWTIHPFFSQMLEDPESEYFNLPFIVINFKAWKYCRDFIENSWDDLREGAEEFIDWMDQNTSDNANLNFKDDQKNIIVRILWSIGFAHAHDHNIVSLMALKYSQCASASSYSNISSKWVNNDDTRYEWCVKQVLVNFVRYRNFSRTFQDMTIFKNMSSWKNLDYNCVKLNDNMKVLKDKITQLIEVDVKKFHLNTGLNEHLTFGVLRPSEFSASINH